MRKIPTNNLSNPIKPPKYQTNLHKYLIKFLKYQPKVVKVDKEVMAVKVAKEVKEETEMDTSTTTDEDKLQPKHIYHLSFQGQNQFVKVLTDS